MSFTPFENDMEIISKLDDEPNDVGGLSADDLKREFDRSGIEIQEYINNTHIPDIEDAIQSAKDYADQKVVEIGAGDMAKAVYDPTHRETDVFAYVDEVAQSLLQYYTTPGTYTFIAPKTGNCLAKVQGAGGFVLNPTGRGGGGGGYVEKIVALQKGAEVIVTVGEGSTSTGVAGEASSFGPYATAPGGSGTTPGAPLDGDFIIHGRASSNTDGMEPTAYLSLANGAGRGYGGGGFAGTPGQHGCVIVSLV